MQFHPKQKATQEKGNENVLGFKEVIFLNLPKIITFYNRFAKIFYGSDEKPT